MVGFLDSLPELLGRARVGLWADSKVEFKAMTELRKCGHPGLKRDIQEYDSLHYLDPGRHWEFFHGILVRIERSAITTAITKADRIASETVAGKIVTPKKPAGSPPPAAPLTADGTSHSGTAFEESAEDSEQSSCRCYGRRCAIGVIVETASSQEGYYCGRASSQRAVLHH